MNNKNPVLKDVCKLDNHSEEQKKILYGAWKNMLYRCYNPNHKRYSCYGERGIEVVSDWHDFDAFFDWAIENDHSEGLTLERINNNGNYEPDNCKWETYSQQNKNRRSVHEITINGETKNATEWCEVYNLNRNTFYTRYSVYGWDIIRAIITPVKLRKRPSGYKKVQ
jgi:hypothetical protein